MQLHVCLVLCVYLCCANFVQTLGTTPRQSHSLDMWECCLASLLVFKVAVTHFSFALRVIFKHWETRPFPLMRKQKNCNYSLRLYNKCNYLFGFEKCRVSNEDQFTLCCVVIRRSSAASNCI